VKIEIDEQYRVVLREVYHPVVIRDEAGRGVAVCERDGRIEVLCVGAAQPQDKGSAGLHPTTGQGMPAGEAK